MNVVKEDVGRYSRNRPRVALRSGWSIILMVVVVVSGAAQAQSYSESILYSFTGGTDGGQPMGGVVRDAQGNLYGTTYYGGNPGCPPDELGCGVVFKLDSSGNETVLHTFAGSPDGDLPRAPLLRDAKGNLYGTTTSGGEVCDYDCGTVFKVDASGNETVLHSFGDKNEYGLEPLGGVVRDAQGNLYGTTYSAYGFGGTVFEVDKNDDWSVLVGFGGPGGYGPEAGVVRDAQGNLYGTTSAGGNGACPGGCGTIFKVDASGNETVLYRFFGSGDGSLPVAGLVRDAEGNLYGTTFEGGYSADCPVTYGCGTVFKLDASGYETVLRRLCSAPNCVDGNGPLSTLVRDSKGSLYGMTLRGGPDNVGTVFKVDKTGNWTVLHSFATTGVDGFLPWGSLVSDAQGNLYGATASGGISGWGTVFKLTLLPATTTTLTSSPNPSTYGQAVTFTAVVTSKAGTPPDAETVSFMQGATLLGTGTLNGGSASFVTSALSIGKDLITAVYGGDSEFAGSTSKVLKQVVKKAAH
jgi:uncharacterized repeat protein (TIGR03803 family)